MSEQDCRDCRDWTGCPGKWYPDGQGGEQEWYSYAEIQWCARQVFWILKNSGDFDGGDWPKPPRDLECDAKKGTVSTEATYCRPKRIIGEVRARLRHCRDKGRILAEQAINREKMEYLDDDIKEILYYASGWPRKDTPFSVWQAVKRYKKYNREKKTEKNGVPVT